MKTLDDYPQVMTLKETGEFLNISPATVRRMIVDARTLPGFKAGAKWRVNRADVAEMTHTPLVTGSQEPSVAATPTVRTDCLDSPRCPFVYANGQQCDGKVASIENYHATVEWLPDGSTGIQPGPRFHVMCTFKGNHAGHGRPDAVKYWLRDLPDDLRRMVRMDIRST